MTEDDLQEKLRDNAVINWNMGRDVVKPKPKQPQIYDPNKDWNSRNTYNPAPDNSQQAAERQARNNAMTVLREKVLEQTEIYKQSCAVLEAVEETYRRAVEDRNRQASRLRWLQNQLGGGTE